MASGPPANVLAHLRKLVGAPAAERHSDADLVGRFVASQDEAAFQAILERHGPMVFGVCRRLLADAHRAEDAFQATFLVLVRKAASIGRRELLANWLYGVALRTAHRARAKGPSYPLPEEREIPDMTDHDPGQALAARELRGVLDAELQHLPQKYRAPVVFCYLEGRSVAEAAAEIGCPRGTVLSRLARGREHLRARLARRGLALSAGAFATALETAELSAAVPTTLGATTLRAAMACALGEGAVASASVTTLATGVMHTMFLRKLTVTAAVSLLALVACTSLGWFAYQSFAAAREYPHVALPQDPDQVILVWDVERPTQPRQTPEPRLQVRADGTMAVRDPYGDNPPVEERLTPQGLQEVLGYVIHAQGFFALDDRQLDEQLRSARLSRGLSGAAVASRIEIKADGRDKALRCLDLVRLEDTSAETRRLAAIERRLERLVNTAYAGGVDHLREALDLANAQLRRDFAEAPALTADDLQKATRGADGRTRIVFERRGVGDAASPHSFVFAQVERPAQGAATVRVRASLLAEQDQGDTKEFPRRTWDPQSDFPPAVGTDKTVKFDYPIVYVRVARPYPKDYQQINHLNQAGLHQTNAPGAELRLLHPDGKDELLVGVKPEESITDPMVSFDGQSVYFAKFHHMSKGASASMTVLQSRKGSDIYRIHIPTRKVVQLTTQERTPNTGAVVGLESHIRGVHSLAPCPVAGGKVVFVSDRNGFRGVREQTQPALQLFIMDEDGSNVEHIGPLNLGTALHPVPLKDGRVMFSSLETQGLRSDERWGIWAIHPDGTNWGPLTSALGSPPGQAVHFQTQLADETIVIESYYQTGSTDGFGQFWKFPLNAPQGQMPFGSGAKRFAPFGIAPMTLFASHSDIRPNHKAGNVENRTFVGNVTHPSAAPDNHMLTVWALPADAQENPSDIYDAGIYLLKSGRPINHPSKMLLIKNEPGYQELWPRALVPYQRIYGVEEPRRLTHANDGKKSPHLPPGTPFGLVGTSSLYKRESYPNGVVPAGSVTGVSAKPNDRKEQWRELSISRFGFPGNWGEQGGDAGLYDNSDIWGIRIVALEPVSDAVQRKRRHFALVSNAEERLRILGEFPVRKFLDDLKQPIDPDGNPDTSFLAKIPADVAWTFQTIDNHGMVLNMAQTWHQVRPGEIRNDCGGCHSHSQKPTLFEQTAAAKADYKVWDLTERMPLFTTKANDRSGQKWDKDGRTGLHFAKGVKDVEFHRDVQPILERSCVACHTSKAEKPAGKLVLDDLSPLKKRGLVPWAENVTIPQGLPTTYHRLTQYSWAFQARRSPLIWKVHGKRLDGFANEDIPSPPLDYESEKDLLDWCHHGKNRGWDVDFLGSQMPPPEAVAGTYKTPEGKTIKVEALSDEDKLTLSRWIDLGCPIDLEYDPKQPEQRGLGWLLDEARPTLTLTAPAAGKSSELLTHILLGMHDYYTGLDLASLSVTADFEIDGVKPGENLASKLTSLPGNRWELRLQKPIAALPQGRLTVSVKDRQGNISKVDRSFAVIQK